MKPLVYHAGQLAAQAEAGTTRVAQKLADWVGPVPDFARGGRGAVGQELRRVGADRLGARPIGDGIGEAREDIRQGRVLPVPVQLRDQHYPGAKRLGHGAGYEYAHDTEGGIAAQDYLGVEREYYRPVPRGFEAELAERLQSIREILRKSRKTSN